MRHNRRWRGAFTLVELLVVIAIIGILMAILLPAVQRARESGRQVGCTNNISQLGKAMATYETQNQKLPCSWGDPTASSIGGASWITMLLPFCEASSLYDQIEMRQALSYTDAATNKYNTLASKNKPSFLKCPSDGSHDGMLTGQVLSTSVAVGVTNYKGVSGCNWYAPPHKFRKADARPNPAVNSGFRGVNATQYNGLTHPDGMLGPNVGSTAPKHVYEMMVRDGLSNTFAIGEAVPTYSNWSAWYDPRSASATCAMPPNYTLAGYRRGLYRDQQDANYCFSSKHPGMVIMGLHGGTTKKIVDEIDLRVWRALATIDGRETTFLESNGEIVQVQMP